MTHEQATPKNHSLRLGAAALALAALVTTGCGEPDRPVGVEVWHGSTQRVGHLGDAQDDFNLMGVASGNEFTYAVNGGAPVPLSVSFDEFGFRRLGDAGHFNADIPIASLHQGDNVVEIRAVSALGEAAAKTTIQRSLEGTTPLPFSIDWSATEHPQDVGQAVDGLWELAPEGLRSKDPLYDRLFLIGERTWTDYRVTATVTVHSVPDKNAPMSGGSGLGFIMRFAGHAVTPPRFPEAQPKWGYQPFGAITWLRWSKAAPKDAPLRQFYSGDRDASEDAAALATFTAGATFGMTAECVTDPGDPDTTTYRFRVWPTGSEEPSTWDYEIQQTSTSALKAGGVALVAHHVDVTFGDIAVRSVRQ